MQPRPYQLAAENAVIDTWAKGQRRALMVMPTGTGKTIVFAQIIQRLVREGERCLILAHRGELLDQAADKLAQATGLGCSVEKADSTCEGEWFRVVVGSVQSMMRERRLDRFNPDFFDAIIVDEAHHVLADSYQRVLAHFPDAKVLGVTATPDRGDMRELGEYFDALAFEYTLPKAIKEGFLCPIKALTIPINIDLSAVSVRAGDFRAEDLGDALGPYLEAIATEMVAYCKGRRTVVFLPLIATSQRFCEILRANGFNAEEVNGQSDDRAEKLARFQAGRTEVLCNSMLLTEGWDCPPLDCVVCLRPTKVRSLYCQIIGRGTRIHPGKENLLLLDFLWLSQKHELCRPAHLLAQNKEVADIMTREIAAAGCPVDLEEAEQAAAGSAVEEREKALAEELARQRNKKRKLVDPLQYEMSIASEDLLSYVPAFGWEAAQPSQVQREHLESLGIAAEAIDSAGHAERVIQTIEQRKQAGLTTPRQIRFLESRGFGHVGQWEFESARKMIARIQANNWRTPPGIDPATYTPAAKPKQEAIYALQ